MTLSFPCGTWETGKVTTLQRIQLSTEADTDTITRVVTKKPWKVIVWDDPVTPMRVVEVIFKKIFGYPEPKCTQLMLTVHHEGKAVVWDGAQDRAIHYCTQLQAAGLMASVEEDK
jgi:ATP-dependent Clp protease adaptor protein ClpS